MWSGRRRVLMARISFICTFAPPLSCNGFGTLWRGGLTGSSGTLRTIPRTTTMRAASSSYPAAGEDRTISINTRLLKTADRHVFPTDVRRASWHKKSHMQRVTTTSAAIDRTQQEEDKHDEREPSGMGDGSAVGGDGGQGGNGGKPERKLRPDKKRILIIPREEWPSYPNFSFDVETECKEGTKARTATLTTPNGIVQTPAFIFCATKAAMKGLSAETMKECGSQVILSNTYHLLVQPGGKMIQKMGGLHKAMRWQGPMLTDSGGYQIFSMGHGTVGDEIKGRRGAEGGAEFEPSLVSIGEKGARFKSYHDFSIKSLTPELSIEIQRQLGADLVVVLDECTPFHVDKDYTTSSMHRTHRWAMRSLREFIDGDTGAQALYGIIQGGVYPDLREEAVDFVNKQPFFGIAVGGSLGADKATMHEVVSQTMVNVRRDRPVHLLGIGGIADIFHGVRQGIDTFDCVHPTRLGRHGGALVKASFWEKLLGEEARDAKLRETEEDSEPVRETSSSSSSSGKGRSRRRNGGGARQPSVPREHVNLMKGRFADDHRVIDENCGCPTCRRGYTRAYINHLGKAGELLGGMLVSQHNVFFMNELMTSIRRAIREGKLDEEEDKWLAPGMRSRDFHHKQAVPRDGRTGNEDRVDVQEVA